MTGTGTAEPDGLEAGLAEVRELLGPDGADVEPVGWDEATGTLRLRLVLESAECAECVLPRPMLDQVLLNMIQTHALSVRALDVDDPRDA
jgi:hypothetical protein